MAVTTRVKVNPKVIYWARRSMDIHVDEAARKINVTEDAYKEIEEGRRQPTLRQARGLAEKFKRPFAIFYLSKPPNDIIYPKDYRSRNDHHSLSTKTRLSIRRARRMQSIFAELSSENKWDNPANDINTKNVNPVDFARLIRNKLDITDEKQLKFRGHNPAFAWYKSILEQRNVLVLFHSFPKKEAKAYCLDGNPAAIVINANDRYGSSNIFSLFHELCHLMLNESGICNAFYRQVAVPKDERFCNVFAGNLIAPSELIYKQVKARNIQDLNDEDNIATIAKDLSVSREVIITRLLEMGRVKEDVYRKLTAKWRNIYQKREKDAKFFARSPVEKAAVRQNGEKFTSLIIDAYSGQQLTYTETADYLNVNQSYVDKVGEEVGRL